MQTFMKFKLKFQNVLTFITSFNLFYVEISFDTSTIGNLIPNILDCFLRPDPDFFTVSTLTGNENQYSNCRIINA